MLKNFDKRVRRNACQGRRITMQRSQNVSWRARLRVTCRGNVSQGTCAGKVCGKRVDLGVDERVHESVEERADERVDEHVEERVDERVDCG